MMLPSRLGCPLSQKTPNMGNTGQNLRESEDTEIPMLLDSLVGYLVKLNLPTLFRR